MRATTDGQDQPTHATVNVPELTFEYERGEMTAITCEGERFVPESETAEWERACDEVKAERDELRGQVDGLRKRIKQVERPLYASDGQSVEVGQTLYGLSDGRKWRVASLDRTRPWSVWGESGGKYKPLKPEWLTHEPPDSLEAVRRDLDSLAFDKDADELMGVRAGELQGIVERIGKLAEGGE